MIVEQSANVLQSSFQDVWFAVAAFVPSILVAVILFLVGWVFGIIVAKIVEQVVQVVRVDEALKATGVNDAFKHTGYQLNVGVLLGTLVKWFVIIVFLVAALDVLGLYQVNSFLQGVVLLYLPNVIVAVLFLILAAIVADIVKNIVIGSARAAGAESANLAGSVAKWSIWVFAVIAALTQLGVASALIQTLFTGLVISISLAFGLAFGLGGKEAAARTIERIRSEVAHHRGD
jgi:hypothetical protein